MQPIRSLIARLRALPPPVRDGVLAALVWIDGMLELLLLVPVAGIELAAGAAIVTLIAAAFAFSRRLPVTALAAPVVGFTLMTEIVGPGFDETIVGPFFWMLLAAYLLGARTRGPHLWVGLAVGGALNLFMTWFDAYPNDVSSYVNSLAIGVAAPALFGHVLSSRARLNHALRAKAEALAESRASAADTAALEERTRIAGELHDVVAHALSAMTVQATAARRIAERDPGLAEQAFATVEATGREALTELRRLLGVLRREDEELGLAPQPSLAHVGSLVRRAQAGGLPVELLIDGEPRPLPAGVDLTAYRLVQETLGRARDAEAGSAAVMLDYGPSELSVEIVDDGAPVGRRLLGLRERVAVYGGKVQAGASESGGWRVTARMPVGRAESGTGAPTLEPLA